MKLIREITLTGEVAENFLKKAEEAEHMQKIDFQDKIKMMEKILENSSKNICK